MVSSDATTPAQYLDELDPDRRDDVAAVRDVVNANLPDGVVEVMRYGMIAWEVPLEVSGPTENGQPIGVAALAAQKHKISLYLSSIYRDPEVSTRFEAAWVDEVGRIDRGRSCVRFKDVEHAAMGVIARAFAELDVDDLVGRSDTGTR